MRLSNRLKTIEASMPGLLPISSDPHHFNKLFKAAMLNDTEEFKRLSTHRAKPLKGEPLSERLKKGSLV